jgi:hypothetical protein
MIAERKKPAASHRRNPLHRPGNPGFNTDFNPLFACITGRIRLQLDTATRAEKEQHCI